MAGFSHGSYLLRVQGLPGLLACSVRPLPLDAPLQAVHLTRRGRKWEVSRVWEVEREAPARN